MTEKLGVFELGIVHEGDCLDLLRRIPDAGIDVIITDPPYSEKVHKGVTGRPTSAKKDRNACAARRTTKMDFDHITPEDRVELCVEFARIVKRWCLIFCDNEGVGSWIDAVEASGLRHIRVGTWVKLDAAPTFSGRYPAAWTENVEIAHTDRAMVWNGGGRGAVWTHPVVINRGGKVGVNLHKNQKPLGLILELVRDFTDPGEIVCDPFSGSGQTGVACKRLGRLFLGFDNDPVWVTRSNENIAREVEMMGLVSARTSKAKQQIGLLAGLEEKK
jgi:site-specific DNA-methyltransferase (adenine-specific)